MKRIAAMTLVLLAAVACDEEPTAPQLGATPALTDRTAAAARSEGLVWNERWAATTEVDGTHWVPCGNDGAGELVAFEGRILITEQWVVTDGRYRYRYRIQPMGLTGIGLETGQLFHDVGGINEHYLDGDIGATTMMFDEVYRMIPPGPAEDFFYRATVHIQYTPEDERVVDIERESFTCR